jgi:hypothetical protein
MVVKKKEGGQTKIKTGVHKLIEIIFDDRAT